MKPIRIITPKFDLLAEVDNYSSLFFTRRWHGIGDVELRINRYLKHTEHLIKGNLLIVGADLNKVFIIKHREIELDQNGKQTENWLIKGLALKSVLAQRITVPPTTTAYDNKQGNAETVMKHYVTNNVIDPLDTARIIEQVMLASKQNRGITVSWQSRYKNLADELAAISLFSGNGWDLTLDLTLNKWVFDTPEGRNLTAGQSILPPVIFSPEFDSLKSLHYTESELNYKNKAFVAGQGEGVNRRVIEVGDYTGLNRHEIFIDARDVAELNEDDTPRPEQEIIDELTDRGRQQLNEFLQEQYLEGQVLTKSPFVYGKHYDLGDIVTVQNKDWGVTMDSRLTEIKEIYEPSGFQLEGTFGNSRPTLIDKIKQELRQTSGEVRR